MRILHIPTKSDVVYCGVIANTGTRDELQNEHGMAHLLEHLFFKGTKKRSQYQVMNCLETVGGELNAYTTKEETVVYSIALKRDFSRAVDLIMDIIFNSTINEDELQKEKEVVKDEIDSYLDAPAESIIDDLEEVLFDRTSLGRNILGTKDSLDLITSDKLIDFYKRCYTTDELLFFSMGDFTVSYVEKLVGKYISHIVPSTREFARVSPAEYIPKKMEIIRNTAQAHCVIGGRAPSISEDEKYAFFLLNNILGGPNMTSKLNMSLRDKNALVYQVDSQYQTYSDTGLWYVYLGTDHEDLPKAKRLVYKEMNKLIDSEISQSLLNRSKRQIIGQLILSQENRENTILSSAKQFMAFNKVSDIEEAKEKYMAVTAKEVLEMAQKYFVKENLSEIIYL
jgi:predicted Zn-dependent peptidase